MPSLEKRVARQRDLLMARGLSIRGQAERVHRRLGHPRVLFPAFLAGMLVARGAPVVRALPRFTAKLRHITDELGRLHDNVRLIAGLAAVFMPPTGTERPGARPRRSIRS